MPIRNIALTIANCVVTLTLAACGGGGGGDSISPATPAANPTVTGLAATGGALANAIVTAKCASGSPVSGNTGVTYSGADTCEGPLLDGTLTMARQQ